MASQIERDNHSLKASLYAMAKAIKDVNSTLLVHKDVKITLLIVTHYIFREIVSLIQ